MHGAAVVPHHEIVHPPAVRVDELALGGVIDQLLDQPLGLLPGHAADRTGVAGDIKTHAAGVLEAAHQHLRHRLEGLALIVVEVAEAQLGARGHQRMLGHQPRDPLLRRLGQRIVGRAQIGELGVAADWRNRTAMQDRAVGRQTLERRIRVPQAIAELVEPHSVVGLQDLVLGVEIADVGELRLQAHLVIGANREHRGLERPEVAREVEMALVREGLVGEDQHGISGEGRADGGQVLRRKRLAEIDVAHFGGEIRRGRLDGDGHWFLPIPCLGCDWTIERPGL